MKLSLFALLGFGLAVGGCAPDKCDNAPNAQYTTLTFQLLNAAGTQTLFVPGSSYSRDSVQLRDEQGLRLDLFPPRAEGSMADISFNLLDSRKAPVLATTTTRQLILYLKKDDQDTVRTEYELTKSSCDKLEIKFLRVFYNQAKVYEGTSTYPSEINVRKP